MSRRPILVLIVVLLSLATVAWLAAGHDRGAVVPGPVAAPTDAPPPTVERAEAVARRDVPTPAREAAYAGSRAAIDAGFRAGLCAWTGRALSPLRAPCADAVVTVEVLEYGGSDADLGPAPWTRVTARSGSDGAFRLDGLWPGRPYDLRIEAPGLVRLVAPDDLARRAVAGVDGVAALGEFVLEATGAIDGRVRRADGAPLRGASVSARALHPDAPVVPGDRDAPGVQLWRSDGEPGFSVSAPPTPWPAPVEVTVGADGAFRVERLSAARYLVAASAPGCAPVARVLEVHPGERVDAGDLALGGAIELRGRVIDADGAPAAGVEVHAVADPGPQAGAVGASMGTTAADGSVLLSGFRGERLCVLARRMPGAPWSAVFDLDPALPFELRLGAVLDLDVAIVDAAGAPLRLGRVERVVTADTTTALRYGEAADLAVDERLARLGDGRVRVVGLAPGTYDVFASDGRGRVGRCRVVLASGATDATVVVDRDALRVAVVAPDDSPVPSARVEVRFETAAWRGFTGADGVARVSAATGPCFVSVSHPRHGDASGQVAPGVADLRVRLRGRALLEGRLVGEAIADYSGWTIGLAIADPAGRDGSYADATAGGDGTFRAALPGAGAVTVLSLFDGRRSVAFEQEGAPTEVQVGAVAHVVVRVESAPLVPRARVRGHVSLGGQVPDGLCIEAQDPANGVSHRARPSPDGSFDLGDVFGPELDLTVVHDHAEGFDVVRQERVIVPEHGVVDLDLRIAGAPVEGTVLDPAGEPLASGYVLVQRVEREHAMLNVTLRAGRFHLPFVAAGTWRAVAIGAGVRSAPVVFDVGAAGTPPVALRVARLVAAEGRVLVTGLLLEGLREPSLVVPGVCPAACGIAPDGAFRLEELLPGVHQVELHGRDAADAEVVLRAVEPLFVEPDGARGVTVRFDARR